MFRTLDKLDKALRVRLVKVAGKAAEFGDQGVVDWANRATNDALVLGRLRDRDVQTLDRLEGTYGTDFYSGGDTISI
jgi:hypothetical protein